MIRLLISAIKGGKYALLKGVIILYFHNEVLDLLFLVLYHEFELSNLFGVLLMLRFSQLLETFDLLGELLHLSGIDLRLNLLFYYRLLLLLKGHADFGDVSEGAIHMLV